MRYSPLTSGERAVIGGSAAMIGISALRWPGVARMIVDRGFLVR